MKPVPGKLTISIDGVQSEIIFDDVERVSAAEVNSILNRATGGRVKVMTAADEKRFAKIRREAAVKAREAARIRQATRARLIRFVRTSGRLSDDDAWIMVEAIKSYYAEDSDR